MAAQPLTKRKCWRWKVRGAPLLQYLDYVAFRDIGPIMTLNIVGISNCQLAHFKNHDYFKRSIPRPAWRLDFGWSYADALDQGQFAIEQTVPGARWFLVETVWGLLDFSCKLSLILAEA